ncbi:hypothetical protein [Gramella sp. MAR_2010_147]|uniref:hypothetical protein n=1 Tax=Gramella sp. MAR_2010_147 TaxID=1250205 RepID=UPI00087CC0F3|nr:hypothetical protein [Gramella sp. MAR_2010_147]SDR85343.1 hypothetical protein SAMN04488553_0865 [Gramella sp. MAR_2010_147]
MKIESILLNIDSTLATREAAAHFILKHPQYLPQTITIITEKKKDLSLKALMALEILSRNNFKNIQRYTPELVHSGKLYNDSASRRYLSKIYGKAILACSDMKYNYNLTSVLKKEIIELSFLWLISKEETAVKVFSMQNLYDLRNEQPWISEELKAIIEKEFPVSSQGFKPRATKILRKLSL